MVRYLFATFHLITLATGIAAAYGRWRALQRVKSTTDLPAVFHADNWRRGGRLRKRPTWC